MTDAPRKLIGGRRRRSRAELRARRGSTPLAARRCFGVHAEVGILVAVLLVWQAARIPFEGSVETSLAHARTWHDIETGLGFAGLEDALISAVHHGRALDLARWGYANLHLFAIVAFMVAIRTRVPERYPPLRNSFVLLHLPALVIIALIPLASPSWLPHPPEWAGNPPTDAELTGSFGEVIRNSTAAAVSEHFGYPVFMLAAALWIAPRSPWPWPLALYPPLVLTIIVGTGHHWVLDAAMGTVTVLVGCSGAWLLHRRAPPVTVPAPEPLLRAVALAVAYALAIDLVDAFSSTRLSLADPSPATFVLPLVVLVAAVVAHRA